MEDQKETTLGLGMNLELTQEAPESDFDFCVKTLKRQIEVLEESQELTGDKIPHSQAIKSLVSTISNLVNTRTPFSYPYSQYQTWK